MRDELKKLMVALPMFACYEGEGDPSGDPSGDSSPADEFADRAKAVAEEAEAAKEAADEKAAEAREAADEAKRQQEKDFSQADLNRFLADDRRKHSEKYQKLEASFKQILDDKNLQKEQRAKMESELADLQKSFRTKEQQAEYERKQERERFTSELELSHESAEKWETLYKSSVVDRSLQDAAISEEAFNPTQIMGLLRPLTKMQEETSEEGESLGTYTPLIDFPDIDETTGEQVVSLRTPAQAVQRMKELPHLYGNLFRPNVVSGVGSGSATGGVQSGDGGRVDSMKLSDEQYRKMRKENPEALGLKRRV